MSGAVTQRRLSLAAGSKSRLPWLASRSKSTPKPSSVSISPRSFSPPRPPVPPKVPLNEPHKADDKSLKKAIDGIEGLMEEAIKLANVAVDNSRTGEVTDLLRGASSAIRRASALSEHHEEPMRDPLPASESSLYESLESSSDLEAKIDRGRTVHQRPLHPHVIVPYMENRREPRSDRGEVVNLAPSSHSTNSASQTPPQFHHKPSANTSSIDWAFADNDQRHPRSSSSESLISGEASGRAFTPINRRSTGLGMRHQNIPVEALEPIPVRPAARDNVEYRPSVTDAGQTPKKRKSVVQSSRGSSLRRRRESRQPHRRHSKPLRSGYSSLDENQPTDKEKRVERDEHHHRPWGEVLHLNELDPNVEMSRKPFRKSHRSDYSTGFGLARLTRRWRRSPIARNWRTARKRILAVIACINTAMLGLIVGIFAGEVPRIQYQLADQGHLIILGNVFLFVGLAITTFLFWPLPLLHGRKVYTVGALSILLPLQFPQALSIVMPRSPETIAYKVELLLPRALQGLVLGFVNINDITALLDLFGASLQSSHPHQELVFSNDVRRHGGGMGLWLGIWSWCWIGSLSVGFLIGASIIGALNPAWGQYITMIVVASTLILNILAPETRRSPHRRCVAEFIDDNERVKREVVRGEVKLHISEKGPRHWWQEVGAGIMLNAKMFSQLGFAVLSVYLGWIYAQIVLVIVLLGALLSRSYRFFPHQVGAGVSSIAIGALLAVPLSKANVFSRDRKQGPRTDSMTFERQITWTSHMVRRILFQVSLPLFDIAYAVTSRGRSIHHLIPIVFAGVIGFHSNLAIAECIGLIMETFDTCDLQPGVNSRHRLQSLAENVRNRRTNYSSFPRVTSGIFVSQTFSFLFAATATGVGGALTRNLGAQECTGITAGVLLVITLLLTCVLWRYKNVQVIPDHVFGTRRNTVEAGILVTEDWKPVIIGNPSGRYRKVNVLELGSLSRWTEIRKLNRLVEE